MRTMEWITQRLLLPLTLALVTVAPGLLYPAPAGAAETLDQSQTVSMSPTTVYNTTQNAQIFTAGMYGYLDRVSLRLENYSASPPTGAVLTVSVQTVIGGLPSGKQIGSGTIPFTDIPPLGNPGWVDISIGPISSALVIPSTQYALVLQTNNVFRAVVTWWYAYTSYAGGQMAFNDGTAWKLNAYAMDNFTFQTYVIPDVLDRDQWRSSESGGHTGTTMGQIFTPTLSGVLDRVDVYLIKSTLPLEVTIQTVAGGYPSGTVIGRGSIPAGPSSLGCSGCYEYWFTAAISGASVIAGTQYALVIDQGSGLFHWAGLAGYPGYPGGGMVYKDANGWKTALGPYDLSENAMFKTYVIPSVASAPPPPPATITPCSFPVCPAVTGGVTPPDSTARVTSNVQFQELPDGTVHGILNFNDSRTGNLVLQGCNTASAACRLTVTTFACTDQHAITVAGAYTPKGETAREYLLTLSGVGNGIGTFTLTADDYTYTLTRHGIVDVTCPSAQR